MPIAPEATMGVALDGANHCHQTIAESRIDNAYGIDVKILLEKWHG